MFYLSKTSSICEQDTVSLTSLPDFVFLKEAGFPRIPGWLNNLYNSKNLQLARIIVAIWTARKLHITYLKAESELSVTFLD